MKLACHYQTAFSKMASLQLLSAFRSKIVCEKLELILKSFLLTLQKRMETYHF